MLALIFMMNIVKYLLMIMAQVYLEKREEALLPFNRLENSRNRNTGGTGLGLSIANNSVLAHGGEIFLEDSPLGGLRVRILLPL